MSKMSLSVDPKYAKPTKADVPAVVTTSLASADPAIWTDTGLTLPAGLSFEEWQAAGEFIGRAEKAVQWWMGDWWRYGEHAYGERAAQAIGTDWSYQTWKDAGWVAGAIERSRRRDLLSWSHHREVAALPPAEQDIYLDRAIEADWNRNELRAAVKRGAVHAGRAVTLPPGKFGVLLADPPWRYDFNTTDAARAIENHYPTMTAEEIACWEDPDGRPIADLPADNAVLFLWATNPKLIDAMAVIQGWGFEYVTNLVWVKDRIGMGYWARQRHELLLVATRGDMAPPPEHLRPDSVMEFPRGAHSAKPPTAHELIEAVWPNLPKVEVFAREARPGWAVFGNQIEPAA